MVMIMDCKQIFVFTMAASKSRIIKDKGESFYKSFYVDTKRVLEEILPNVPNIGNSLFGFNYKFGVCYIAWYKALKGIGVDEEKAIKEIWNLTESFLQLVPQPLMRIAAKSYLKRWRKKAPAFEMLGNDNKLHPFDYKIRYIEIDSNTFELDFYECGMKKLYHKFNVMGLMPGVCRIDYLMFNYMGVGFTRNKTLGDGDDCCNCRYSITGDCDWSPEKGFTTRK